MNTFNIEVYFRLSLLVFLKQFQYRFHRRWTERRKSTSDQTSYSSSHSAAQCIVVRSNRSHFIRWRFEEDRKGHYHWSFIMFVCSGEKNLTKKIKMCESDEVLRNHWNTLGASTALSATNNNNNATNSCTTFLQIIVIRMIIILENSCCIIARVGVSSLFGAVATTARERKGWFARQIRIAAHWIARQNTQHRRRSMVHIYSFCRFFFLLKID